MGLGIIVLLHPASLLYEIYETGDRDRESWQI